MPVDVDETVASPAEVVEPEHAVARPVVSRASSVARRLLLALTGVAIFVYAIQLMKASALAVRPFLETYFGSVATSPFAALGFGWGSAYLVLSGSPVAAVGVGLLDQGFLSPVDAYFLIMGSRLGAAFIVIVIGVVAIARGGGREECLSVGVLSFLVTYSVYLPAIFLGFLLLDSGTLTTLTFRTPGLVLGLLDAVVTPLVSATVEAASASVAFVLSLGALYLGLSVFDRAFHRREIEELQTSAVHRYLQRPPVAFLIGATITLASTSVSLSLGLLVPLYLKGYVRRREIIPYIMGANITTFVDTLLVAVVLDNPVAINLLFVQMVAVTLVSLAILVVYKPYREGILRLFHYLFHSNRALAAFAVLNIAAPVALVLLG
jgi:Na+/phosphate symporter